MSIKRLFGAALAALLVLAAPAAFAARDTLTLGMVLEPPHLDPTAGAAAAIDQIVYANVFQGLTRIDRHGRVRMDLAKSVDISKDGLSYTFHLHHGVSFHDGTPFTASDVVFSYQRAMAKDSVNPQKQLFAPIASMATPDPYTVVIHLKHRTGNFLYDIGRGAASIVAPESAAHNKTDPIGTGPFKFKRWVSGDRVELVRSDHYWGKPVALKEVTFKFISNPAAAAAAMMSGGVDAFASFPAPELLAQFKADPRYRVVAGTTEGEVVLSTNNAHKPFNELKVRRAMAYAIDRQAIIQGAEYGYGVPIGSHYAPNDPCYVDLTGMYPHDPAKARKLLAAAGYPHGFDATLTLPPPSYARRSGQIIANQLAKVGIHLKIIQVEWAQWLKQVFHDTDYDLSIVAHIEPNDIGIYARKHYYFNYHNPKFNKVMAKLAVTNDHARRCKLLGQAQRILARDAVNGFLFQLPKLGVWNKKLKGLWRNSPVPANVLTAVHWSD